MKKHLAFLSDVCLTVSSLIILLYATSTISQAQQNVRGIHVAANGQSCSGSEAANTKPSNNDPNLAALKGAQQRWALVIGVDNYANHNIENLGGAWHDASAMGTTLEKYGGFDTRLLSNAAREEILNTLQEMGKQAKGSPPELLLVSISGHGFLYNGESYLLPADARVDGKLRSLLVTSIRTSEIKAYLKSIGAKQILIFLDVCLVSIDQDLDQTGQMEIDFKGLNTADVTTVYAAQVGYPSYENKSKQVGYFTSALVEGLRGSAANAKGEVSVKGLYTYASQVVRQQVCKDFNGFQKPFAKIEGSNLDSVILSAVKP